MTHQEILWLLQSCWEACVTLGPLAAIVLLTWRVSQ
jgi:hypothetical protein